MAMSVSRIMRDLERIGLKVVIGNDFVQYRNYRSMQAERSRIYPMFDVTSSYIDDTNGLWICGFNESGEIVHTQAARLLDLDGTSLANHLDVHRHKYITPGSTPDPDATFYRGPTEITEVGGRVCYNGDFWLAARGLGGHRSRGATTMLSRLLLEVVSMQWEPDFAFAFVPRKSAEKGVHFRYGYKNCEYGAWVGPDGQLTTEEYLIWMSGSDIKTSLARELQPIEEVVQLATIKAVKASEAPS
jgi:hypothetical protein